MRLAGLTLAAALAAASPSAANQLPLPSPAAGTVPVSTLAPEEVLLELQVTGVARRPADTAMLVVYVNRTAATAAEARAALTTETSRIVAAARRAGVSAGDIQLLPAEGPRAGFVGNEAFEVIGVDALPPALRPAQQSASAAVEIRLRDPEGYDRVRDAIETAETAVPAPVFSLSDREAATREARADAIRKARAEAEDYARAMGMRVARLVRISAASGSDYDVYYQIMLNVANVGRDPRIVETAIGISAAFALAPIRKP